MRVILGNRRKALSESEPLLILDRIEDHIKQGETGDVINAQISSLKEKGNYLDILRQVLRFFPDLTVYLVRSQREDLMKDFERLNLKIETLPQETQLELLSLLSPDKIHQTIHQIPENMRAEWLREPIQFEQFSGAVLDVLGEVKTANVDGATPDALINLTPTMAEFFKRFL